MDMVERCLLLGQEALWSEYKAHGELFTSSYLLGLSVCQ